MYAADTGFAINKALMVSVRSDATENMVAIDSMEIVQVKRGDA